MSDIKIEMIEKLFQYTSSKQLINNSIKILCPQKKEIRGYLFAITISGIIAYLFSTARDTEKIFFETVESINDVVIALFGIVFTGYALFQALIGKEMLIRMLSNTVGEGDDEKSKLQESNENFAETMGLQFICILLNIILIAIGKCIPAEWNLVQNRMINVWLSAIGIFFYFYLIFISILEIKGFIYNIFQLFNLHAGSRIIETLKEDKKSDDLK